MFGETEISNLHKDELSPPAGEYAANLEEQVKTELSKLNCGSIEDYVAIADPENLKKMVELLKQLEHIRQYGEMEFNEEDFNDEFGDVIQKLVDDKLEGRRVLFYDNSHVDDIKRFLNAEIAKIPNIPIEKFSNDPKYFEYLLKKSLENKGDAAQVVVKNIAGLLVSGLFNRSLLTLPSLEQRNQIYQEIDLTTWGSGMSEIGFMLNGGKIRIKGDAGRDIGSYAKGGEIEADGVANNLGKGMEGGKIKAKKAGTNAGSYATGGELEIEEADDSLGSNLNGASIRVKRAGRHAGFMASSGLIVIEEYAGDNFGSKLNGATLKAKRVGSNAGEDATAGYIEVDEAGDNFGRTLNGANLKARSVRSFAGNTARRGLIEIGNAGSYMGSHLAGAKIVAKKAWNNVGDYAASGIIEIDEATDSLGNQLNGATIKVRKTGGYVGTNANSGEIHILEEYGGLGKENIKIDPEPGRVKKLIRSLLKTKKASNFKVFFNGQQIV